LALEKPLHELSIGEILNQTFSLYFARFGGFFVPFLVAGLITGAWSTFVSLSFPFPEIPSPYADPEVMFSWLFAFLGVLFWVLALTFIVSWIVGSVVQGMAIKYASDILEKRDTDLSKVFSFTVSRLLSLLVASIITGILIAVGLVCLIVPGIILAIMFSLVVPSIMIEQVGALESLSRSRRLVSKRWGKTFVLLLIIYILIIIASLIFDAVSAPLGESSWIISGPLTALVQPIVPISMTLLYYSMLIKEKPPEQP
jgi:hypothetical protein